MATAEHEKVMFAREVFNLFVKAYTNLKLYPHHHQHCTSTVEEFTGRLRSFVKLHNVLRITVTQDALQVGEDAVYENPDAKENLAFRMYVDGLREINISNGVTADEAEKLCMVFYTAIVDQEADCTLLLWESDFQNIDYAAINSLTEAWESPDYFSSEHLQLLKDMNNNVEAIVQSLTANKDRGAYQFELTDGGQELESILEMDESEDDEDREDDDIFQVDEDALSVLQREVQVWGPDRLLRVVVDQALDGFALERDIIDLDTVTWLLQEAVSLSMRSRDMELLGALLARYEMELSVLSDEDDVAAFISVFKWLGREENIDRLVGMAKSGKGVGGPRAFCRILKAMQKPGMVCAVGTFLESDNAELKDALANFLKDNVKSHPMAMMPMFEPDQSAEIVKTGMFVINQGVKGKKLAALLNRCMEHPDPEITKYATHLWRTNTRQGRAVVLMDALMAAKRADRVKALQALVRLNHKPAIDALKTAIASTEFPRRDMQERAAYIEALRLLGGTAVVAYLEDLTRRKTMIFNRKSVKQIRAFAQKALNDLKTGG
jgi:hypothetical protein